jgi:hypothetical protein
VDKSLITLVLKKEQKLLKELNKLELSLLMVEEKLELNKKKLKLDLPYAI